MDYSKDQFNCPVEATLFLIGGKYKPPRTLYSLTSFGRGMIPVLNAMRDWDAGFWMGWTSSRHAAQKISRRTLTGFPASVSGESVHPGTRSKLFKSV